VVARGGADPFIARWRAVYAEQFPSRAVRSRFLVTAPGAPAGSGGRMAHVPVHQTRRLEGIPMP